MPTVPASKRQHIALLAWKLLAIAVIAMPLALSFHAPAKPTVTPVLANSDQEISPEWGTPNALKKPDLQFDPQTDQQLDQSPDIEPALNRFSAAEQTATPDDTFADQQWSFHAKADVAGATGLFGSHEFLSGTSNVVVAVVDSGVILTHEDLNFLPGYDFIHNPTVGNDGDGRDHDPSDSGDWVTQEDINQGIVSQDCPVAASKWHGTAIAGIIAATAYNSTGIAGGSPNVSLLPVRVTGKCGGYVSDLIDGIRWAAGLEVNGVANNQYPADVINLSVGFPGACSNAMQKAIDDAVNAGAVLVTAATNSAVDLDTDPYSPAACKNVLTVAATDRKGAITPYTALGESVFISAPGGTVTDGIITTQNDGNAQSLPASSYGYHYGTSIAAAHVSSAIANLLSHTPDLNKTHIEQLLSASASSIDFDPNCRSGQCGDGALDAYAAMQLLATNYLLDDGTNDTATETVMPVQLAAANAVDSAVSVTTTTVEEDNVLAGSVDRALLLLLILVFGQRYYSRRLHK